MVDYYSFFFYNMNKFFVFFLLCDICCFYINFIVFFMICVMDISGYFVMIIILFVNYIFMFNIEFLFWNSCFFFMVNNDIMVCSIFIVYMFFFILDIYNM